MKFSSFVLHHQRPMILFTLFIFGASILFYRGPMSDVMRGNVGDVVIVTFLSLGFGYWTTRWWQGSVLAFVIALSIESAQLFLQTQNTARDVVLGAVFDWWDIVAYAVGAIVGAIIERLLRR